MLALHTIFEMLVEAPLTSAAVAAVATGPRRRNEAQN